MNEPDPTLVELRRVWETNAERDGWLTTLYRAIRQHLAAHPDNTVPTENLPDGVWRVGESFVLDGDKPLPVGWQIETDSAGFDQALAVVRLIPAPKTEWVPWWKAVGRLDESHQRISTVGHGFASSEPFFITSGGLRRTVTRADGQVEVQVQS